MSTSAKSRGGSPRTRTGSRARIWPREVPAVRYETEDEVAAIDPLLPPDGDFDPGGKPVNVLLTYPPHYRGTADFDGDPVLSDGPHS